MAVVRVECFLCKAKILYGEGEQARLIDHLRSEHSVEAGEDFLIAGCLMNPEEREAIVNVVKEREPVGQKDTEVSPIDSMVEDIVGEISEGGIEVGDVVSLASLVPETTLQEGPEVNLQFGEASPPRIKERAMVEFPCPECSLSFKLKIKLNRHMKLHAKKEDIKSEPISLKPIVKTEKGTPRKQGPRVWIPSHDNAGVPCPDCGKRFKSNGPMQRHYEDIHQPGEFPCKGCGKMFSSKNKMSSHYSRHCNPNRHNNLGSRIMPRPGYVTCFMCKAALPFKKGNLSKYRMHMKVEHKIICEIDDYILAGCFMSSEERAAVKDVVMDKIRDAGYEDCDENISPPGGEGRSRTRYKCDYCSLSFTLQSNLAQHLDRKHKTFKLEGGGMNTGLEGGGMKGLDTMYLSTPVFIDTNKIKTEPSIENARKEKPVRKKSNRELKTDRIFRRNSVSITGRPVLAELKNHPGDGKICRLCSKEFRSNCSMKRHFEDIHNPGEYPCKGCRKMFTSKNKLSSHYSRNCKRKTL